MSGYPKDKARRKNGSYFALYHRIMDSPNYRRLSAKAVKLLNDLGRQYNGKNNGDLCAAFSRMEEKRLALKVHPGKRAIGIALL